MTGNDHRSYKALQKCKLQLCTFMAADTTATTWMSVSSNHMLTISLRTLPKFPIRITDDQPEW